MLRVTPSAEFADSGAVSVDPIFDMPAGASASVRLRASKATPRVAPHLGHTERGLSVGGPWDWA
jgi:hypothetical protein